MDFTSLVSDSNKMVGNWIENMLATCKTPLNDVPAPTLPESALGDIDFNRPPGYALQRRLTFRSSSDWVSALLRCMVESRNRLPLLSDYSCLDSNATNDAKWLVRLIDLLLQSCSLARLECSKQCSDSARRRCERRLEVGSIDQCWTTDCGQEKARDSAEGTY